MDPYRPRIGERIERIETPAVVVDLDTMEQNVDSFVSFAQDHDVTLRSHAKTHKNAALARMQDRRTNGGIICQTLEEVEYMAENGLDDIYLTHMIVNDSKLRRLVQLSQELSVFQTTVDGRGNVDPLQEITAELDEIVSVVLEVDLGLERVGVGSIDDARELAAHIRSCSHLELVGVMGFEGHINAEVSSETEYERRCREAMDNLERYVNALRDDGHTITDVKVGSTGTSKHSGRHPVVTEINPGMYPFNDANLLHWAGPVTKDDCALTVLTTVVSEPTRDRVIVDAGSKTMSFDVDQMPVPADRSDLEYYDYSEEHGFASTADASDVTVGDRLSFIPPHVCTTINLHDRFYGVRDGRIEEVYDVGARGALR
jgi:3-hydroxy-D-aspartate aldolase